MRSVVLNFVHFIKNIKHIGAVAPSSVFLAHDMTEPMRKALRKSPKPIRVLELGPGTGPITRDIVSLLRPDDKLDIVEIDPQFYKIINKKYNRANIDVYNLNVLDFDPGYTYDFILSSIPYDQLPQEVSTEIWKKQLDMLKPNAFFTYFKYYKFNFIRGQFERGVNKKHCIKKSFVLRNVPPAFVYTLKF
jgi:phosphatidylethanolamine/phosphatidyl-N-methylethanolamine N-methyltransferase